MANIHVPLASKKLGVPKAMVGNHLIIVPAETAAIGKSKTTSVGKRIARPDRNDSRMEAVFPLPKGRPLACPPRLPVVSWKRSCSFQNLSSAEHWSKNKKQRVEAKETVVCKYEVPTRTLRQPCCEGESNKSYVVISSEENELSFEDSEVKDEKRNELGMLMVKNDSDEKSWEHLSWVITLLASLHEKAEQS